MHCFEQAAKQYQGSAKDGSIGAALQDMENIEDMTPEEAGKQFGELLKGLEQFAEGMEESVEESVEESEEK